MKENVVEENLKGNRKGSYYTLGFLWEGDKTGVSRNAGG